MWLCCVAKGVVLCCYSVAKGGLQCCLQRETFSGCIVIKGVVLCVDAVLLR